MSKIEDFENKMIRSGMSGEEFKEYKLMLRRVHDNWNRYQHCILAALRFDPEYCQRAILLIEYAVEEFGEEYFLTRNPYEAMGDIYFKAKKYDKSYESYLRAFKMYSEKAQDHRSSISEKLLWAKLHLDDFRYSEEIEEYYSEFIRSDAWDTAFLNSKLRRYAAELVISLHYKNAENAKISYENIKNVLSPEHKGEMYEILRCHKYAEHLEVTDKVSAFLEKTETAFSDKNITKS